MKTLTTMICTVALGFAATLHAAQGSLRGFGNCEAVRDGVRTDFRCDSTNGAECVLGKLLWDLSYNDGAKWNGKVLETAGGAFAFARRGVVATVVAAATRAEVEAALAADADLADSCVIEAKCPEWMKRFSWGTYGMGGLENFHDWMTKWTKEKGERLDPREDMEFLRQMGPMHFDNWAQPEKMDNSDGILSPMVYWRAKYAEENGIPYSYRLYTAENGYGWSNRRFADLMERPAEWMLDGWHGAKRNEHVPHVSWYQADGWRYLARQTHDFMRALKTDNVRGWMHPAGELVHRPWYDMHSDYSEAAQRSWSAYLRSHGVTLAEAEALDWSQVKVPEFASFTGLPGMILDLAGTWRYSRDGKTFGTIAMPGNHDFQNICFPRQKPGETDPFAKPGVKARHCLFTRTFDFDAATANGGRVYLYFFPMSTGTERHALRLNGHDFGEVGPWCGVDATEFLKPLANELEIVLEGDIWNGRIFLSTEAPSMYPRLPGARNKIYTLWCSWLRDTKAAICEETFDAMRQADPNAPIKFMAPIEFGWPIVNRLMSTWGSFAHFTGEGMWFFPWYKRYGKLWGYQGTSELAGPENTVELMRRSTLRVFLAGLDMHEPVFLTQTYSRNPELRKWWLDHRPLLNRMGRQDIFGPQVLIYRRSLACKDSFAAPVPAIDKTMRRVNTPWDWDIGRGTLQSFGASMLYVDDDGIEAGKTYGHKVMVDCGNEIIPEGRLEEIAEWVRDGGTYVAFPFTGRSTELEGDSWPISKLAGARVAKERPLGGTVKWYGRDYADKGRSLDHLGRNRVEYSLELEPSGDNPAKAIAFYENGKPAVMERRIGRGRVIWFGSLFWRDAADIMGIWWPGARETSFWRDFLAEVGFPKPLCDAEDPLVWAQPYRSNDGLDFVTCLCNFNTNGVQKTMVTLRVPRRPGGITVYSGEGVKSPAFTYEDGVVKFELALQAQEVAMVNAKGVYAADDALAYWWREQRTAWKSSPAPKLDLEPYRHGRWADPTQDLKTGWTFEDGRPCTADWLQVWGLEDGKGATIAKTFDVEKSSEWFKGGRIYLVTGSWVGDNSMSKAKVTLNGVPLTDGKTNLRYIQVDVTDRLKATGNRLAIAFDAPDALGRFTGLLGSIYLYHRAAADVSMPVAALPYRLYVPKSWEGRYRVFFHAETAPGRHPPLGVKVGSRLERKHHHNFGHMTDVDITGIMKFGEDNLLEPFGGDKVPTTYRIELYEGNRRP